MSDPKLIPNSFTSYQLTESQELAGSVFTQEQCYVLQNETAVIAEQKLRLEYDPINQGRYTQEEAYLRGQLDLLQHLLQRSEALKNTTTYIED